MFYCGTSGFSYDDWAGTYYPEKLPRRNWLSYYSQEFNALELNTTYYALPGEVMVESLVKKTADGFLFAVKANQDMTHNRTGAEDTSKKFCDMLQPLLDAHKLGCVLAQFPNSFNCSDINREFLKRFRQWMKDLPLVIEFRNAGWVNERTFSWLKDNNVGYCCVDEPDLPGLLPPLSEVTGDIGYIRFHGRNVAKWWHHEFAWERYDYTYKNEELAEWIPRIAEISRAARNTFIFANNHWRSQAVDTIRQVRSMLDQIVL